jgi:hypothetical protein
MLHSLPHHLCGGLAKVLLHWTTHSLESEPIDISMCDLT